MLLIIIIRYCSADVLKSPRHRAGPCTERTKKQPGDHSPTAEMQPPLGWGMAAVYTGILSPRSKPAPAPERGRSLLPALLPPEAGPSSSVGLACPAVSAPRFAPDRKLPPARRCTPICVTYLSQKKREAVSSPAPRSTGEGTCWKIKPRTSS